MTALLQQTKFLLKRYRIFPRKKLGQNFMVDKFVLQLIVDYAELEEDDIVLEIGAGLGFLTELLARKAEKVIAVEIDPRLTRVLRKRLRGFDNIEIIEGNILKTQIPFFNRVASTPPYSISSPLLFWLLNKNFESAVLTFQEEFAERLNAPVGSENYSRLTVSVYYHAEVEILDLVPKEAFYPPPEVDSVIVRIKPRKTPPFKLKNQKMFEDIVNALFTQKNKKVRNALVKFLIKKIKSKKEALKIADSLPFKDKRVRELAPEDFGALANELSQKNLL